MISALFLLLAVGGDALKVDLVPKAQAGQGQPELVVKAEVPLKKLTLEVVRSSDGKKLKLSSGPLGAGREYRFALEMKKPGTATFDGKLLVELDNGVSGEMPINVKGELLDQLQVEVKPEDVDLSKKTVALTASREISALDARATASRSMSSVTAMTS